MLTLLIVAAIMLFDMIFFFLLTKEYKSILENDEEFFVHNKKN